MSVSKQIRQHVEITVRYAHHLQGMGTTPSFAGYARRCAKVTGDRRFYEAAAKKAYDGITRTEMDRVEAARRNYHTQKLSAALAEFREPVMSISPEGRHRKTHRLSALENRASRTLLCKAVHDTAEWEYKDPEEVADEEEVQFKVWRLENAEVEHLTRLSLRAAHHQVRLRVLDDVRTEVNGADRYEAPAHQNPSVPQDGQSPEGETPSEVAAKVLEGASADARPSDDLTSVLSSSPEAGADIAAVEEGVEELSDTAEMIYDEVEGEGSKRYIDAEEAGEILGLSRKRVLNRSRLDEDHHCYIPSLKVAGSNRKRFDRKVIERLLEPSDR